MLLPVAELALGVWVWFSRLRHPVLRARGCGRRGAV